MQQYISSKMNRSIILLIAIFLSQSSFSQRQRTYYSLNPDEPGEYIHEVGAGMDGNTLIMQYTHLLYGPINWRKNLLIEDGNVAKISFTDTLGNLKSASSIRGYTPISKFEYDNDGNKIAESYWEDESTPTNYYNQQFHALKSTYDSIGNKKSTRAFTIGDSLICNVHYKYKKGSKEPSQFSYHHADGSLMKIPTAKVAIEFDKKGRVSKKIFTSNTGLEDSRNDVKMIRYKYKLFQMRFGNQVSSSRKVVKFYNAKGKKIDKYLSVNFGPPGSDSYKHMEIINFMNPREWMQ